MKIKKTKLSKEERAVEVSIGRGEFVTAPQSEREALQAAARLNIETRKKEAKEARVNIRMSALTLELVRKAAEKEGLPYQTYIASTLHKVITGQFVARSQWQELLDRVSSKKAG